MEIAVIAVRCTGTASDDIAELGSVVQAIITTSSASSSASVSAASSVRTSSSSSAATTSGTAAAGLSESSVRVVVIVSTRISGDGAVNHLVGLAAGKRVVNRRALGLAMGQLRIDPTMRVGIGVCVGICVAIAGILLLLLEVALPVGLAGMRLGGSLGRHGVVRHVLAGQLVGTVEDVSAASLRDKVLEVFRGVQLAGFMAIVVRSGKVPNAGGASDAATAASSTVGRSRCAVERSDMCRRYMYQSGRRRSCCHGNRCDAADTSSGPARGQLGRRQRSAARHGEGVC